MNYSLGIDERIPLYLHPIIIPITLSLFFLYRTLRIFRKEATMDVAEILKLLWIIPLLFTWVVYLSIILIIRS